MKKSTLYAPRLKGDIDLGLEPSRLAGDGEKRWAEIIAPGGRRPGQTVQGIHGQSLTQKYRIGTRRIVDERVFRYARAGSVENLIPTYGVVSDMTFPETHAAAGSSAIDAYTVTCEAVAAVGEDDYAEGWLSVGKSGVLNKYPMYRIKSNTAQATPGSDFVVTLYEPLVETITEDGEPITLFKNQYAGVRSIREYFTTQSPPAYPGFEGYSCFVGVPIAVKGPEAWGRVSKSYWCWIQTWGPCILSGYDNYGASPGEMRMVFHPDGSIKVASGGAAQLAGYLLPNTYWSATGHDLPSAYMLINLMISP